MGRLLARCSRTIVRCFSTTAVATATALGLVCDPPWARSSSSSIAFLPRVEGHVHHVVAGVLGASHRHRSTRLGVRWNLCAPGGFALLADDIGHAEKRVVIAELGFLAAGCAITRALVAPDHAACLLRRLIMPSRLWSAQSTSFLVPGVPYDGCLLHLAWRHVWLTTFTISSPACSAHARGLVVPGVPYAGFLSQPLWEHFLVYSSTLPCVACSEQRSALPPALPYEGSFVQPSWPHLSFGRSPCRLACAQHRPPVPPPPWRTTRSSCTPCWHIHTYHAESVSCRETHPVQHNM